MEKYTIDKYFVENYEELTRIAKFMSTKNYEDLVQNTYLEAKKSEESLRSNNKNSIKYFINTIMKRQSYLIYGEKEIPTELTEEFYCVHETNTTINKEEGIDTSQMLLMEMLLSLSMEDQLITSLLINGFSQKEISHLLHMNYSTIRTKISRLRNILATFQ